MDIESFEKMTIGDLKLLSQLPLYHSVSALAANLGLDAGNLNRRLAKLEDQIGCKVMRRTRLGFEITENGVRALQQVNEIINIVRTLPQVSLREQPGAKRRLRTVGRGFLVEWMIAIVYPALAKSRLPLQFDWMDASPEASESWARLELVDIVLSLGDVTPGEDWVSLEVGTIRWVPIARQGHPLFRTSGRLAARDLAEFPLVGFSYVEGGLLYRRRSPLGPPGMGVDGCHSQSSRMTIMIVNSSDHLAVVPDVALKCWPQEVRPKVLNLDAEQRTQALSIHAHKDRVVAGDLQFLRQVALDDLALVLG